MTRPFRNSIAVTVGVGLLLALLVVLGLFQYRWAGELSRAERGRLDRGLTRAVERFAEEFDREVSRAFLYFVAMPGSDDEAAYLQLLEGWEESAPYPELVRDLVLMTPESAPGTRVRTARLGAGEFVDGEWDPTLDLLKPAQREESGRDLRSRRGSRPSVLIPEIPALVPPRLGFDSSDVRRSPMERRGERTQPRVDLGRVAVRLDVDYLCSELFPLLAERHLGTGGDEPAYRYAIVSDVEEGRLICPTGVGLSPAEVGNPDGEGRLLRILPPERLGQLPREVLLSRTTGVGPPGSGFRPDVDGAPGRRRGWPGFGGTSLAGEGATWRLVVQHQAGSLAAAVARNRRRNLGVSAVVLALLGVVVVLLVVSSRRAQELATRRVEFVAGVSHELRTPLASIRSLGQNLADGIVEGGEPVRRYGELIEAESSRLARMIEQVLDYSRGLSGERRLERQSVDLEAVVASAVERCRPQLERAGVALESSVGEGLSPILGDAAALGGAIENLIVNAIKFGGDGGWVGLYAEPFEGTSARIRVVDRGPGIDAEDRSHLFEPFYRGSRAKGSQKPGSGLGLSLVREVVEAHGGTVEASAAEGGGAQFTIYLPGGRDVS